MSERESASDVVHFAVDRILLRGVALALAGGALLAFSGAFGLGEASLLTRLSYWLPFMLMGSCWGHVCSRLIERHTDPDRRPWLTITMLTLLISGPLSLAVWAITGLFFRFGRELTLAQLPDFLLPVMVVTGAISALNVFLAQTPVQTHAALPGAKPARFIDRLPFKLKGAVIRAVQSEDHYLRIHTDRGSDLILMRLSDALTELEGLEGAQTHRSWWVAKDAVLDVSRGDGRATLTLEGGVEAPVSRRYAKALRDAGWY